MFARVAAEEPMTACHVQHGLLLLGTGERMLARLELGKALRRLDAAAAPTLAALTAVGLASCEASAGRAGEAAARLATAKAVWRRLTAQTPARAAMPRPWRELLEAADDPGKTGAAATSAAPLRDSALFALLAVPPWRESYPSAVVTLADRLLLGRAEDEPAAGIAAGTAAEDSD